MSKPTQKTVEERLVALEALVLSQQEQIKALKRENQKLKEEISAVQESSEAGINALSRKLNQLIERFNELTPVVMENNHDLDFMKKTALPQMAEVTRKQMEGLALKIAKFHKEFDEFRQKENTPTIQVSDENAINAQLIKNFEELTEKFGQLQTKLPRAISPLPRRRRAPPEASAITSEESSRVPSPRPEEPTTGTGKKVAQL